MRTGQALAGVATISRLHERGMSQAASAMAIWRLAGRGWRTHCWCVGNGCAQAGAMLRGSRLPARRGNNLPGEV
jgi:hypothetical protein